MTGRPGRLGLWQIAGRLRATCSLHFLDFRGENVGRGQPLRLLRVAGVYSRDREHGEPGIWGTNVPGALGWINGAPCLITLRGLCS